MNPLQSYTRLETLQIGSTMVYRARRSSDGQRVVIKQIATPFPDPTEVARLRREFEIQSSVAGEGVVEALGFESADGIVGFVMRDDDGDSVRVRMRAGSLSLREALTLGSSVARALRRVHALRVVHKDINPANIIWTATGIRLIDFGVASVLAREVAESRPAELFEGTLAYAAPEQTGRMNRPIDARTDLYALGVTLYEVLAQRRPFPGDDPLALVHAHLALEPPPLHTVAPHVPPAVCAIVHRLLAKHAEDRYPTAAGLAHDLDACLDALVETGSIPEMVLGGGIDDGILHLSDRIYGREAELATLDAACVRTSEGGSEVLLIAGEPGVGKSAIAGEASRMIGALGGRVLQGKCEQLNRSVPFAPFLEAFEELIDGLIALPPDALELWRVRLADALGPNIRVLTDVVSRLELVLGTGHPLADVTPAEAANRFRLVLQNFVRALPQPGAPLMLLIDDLQWADRASLDLLETLATDPDTTHILFLATCRDAEVSAHSTHVTAPGRLLPAWLADRGVRCSRIGLEPLSVDAVAALVADAVSCDRGTRSRSRSWSPTARAETPSSSAGSSRICRLGSCFASMGPPAAGRGTWPRCSRRR